MCPAIENDSLGSVVGESRWSEKLAGIGAIASKAATAVSNGADFNLSFLSLTSNLWRLDNLLRDCISGIYREAGLPASKRRKAVPTFEEIKHAVQELRAVQASIEQLHAKAKAAGLTNRTLTGAVLNSVLLRSDELLEIADAIDLALNPGVDACFDRALSDLANGEVYDLAAFR